MELNHWISRFFLILVVYALYAWGWQQAFGEIPSSPIPSTTTTTLLGQPISEEQLQKQLQDTIHFHPEGNNTVGYIKIGDRSAEINQSTWLYVKSALEYYKKNKPAFILLELNTPGGEVFSALQIAEALKNFDIQEGIPVIAYINNWAISAGAMIAYSCRFIAVVKDASMGAAEPVMQDEAGKLESASEKVNSAIRTDFANKARFFDRNPLLAEAMVDKDMVLVLRDGRVTKLEKDSQIQSSDLVISPKGKLLTLDSRQLLDYGIADFMIPPKRMEGPTSEEISMGRWGAYKEPLFQVPFFAAIPDTTVDQYQMDWKMKFFALLASPMVSSLLFLGLVVCAYIELNTPGFGLAGSIAVLCLFLIVLSSFSLQIANSLELIFLIAGLVILGLEIFVLPTFGVLGFVGILLFLAGLFGMMIPGIDSVSFENGTSTLNAAGEMVLQRLAWLCGTLLAALAIIVILARYVAPNLTAFQRFVLIGNEQVGYQASEYDKDVIGKIGVAETDLKPGGYILVDGKRLQALSQSGYIVKGSSVEIISGQEESLLVKMHEKETS